MRNKDWVLVVLLGVFWGASLLFVEIPLSNITPVLLVYLRVAAASALSPVYIVLQNITYRLTRRDYFDLFVMGLFNNVIPFLLIVDGRVLGRKSR